MRKKIIICWLVTLCIYSVSGQVKLPAASPSCTLIQDFGLGKITITYSKPALKGRTYFAQKSELAPWGELWRLGANAATKVSFTDPVDFGGKLIESGTYVMYAIPNEKEWEIILNKGVDNWGTSGYQESLDVARIKVPVIIESKNVNENFVILIKDITPTTATFKLGWGRVNISFPIKTDITAKLEEGINNELNKVASLTSENQADLYFTASTYYFDYKKNNDLALEYINKCLAIEKEAFWIFLQKAKILKTMDRKEEAKQAALDCKKLAENVKNQDYARYAVELIKSLN